ncbi:MFS transporter [Amycolatopsis rhizosphaerae]|uniref:MFS transporter n=1 Tax=Amycolatopsis rhizosphaerae TaxID=2053003 RepID=A0A558DE67_9PSEU|nr:MFS transporter [Amycolatopsis rhizosphaerae]TVT59327.1 MFS transporter [Amycolatopsis rhizosphaerae]
MRTSSCTPRRLEAFAVFNVFYQGGILAGPLVGLALTAVDFRLTCLVAAAVFAVLTLVQLRALPPRAMRNAGKRNSVLAQWRTVASNRTFMLFALVMTGSYVLSFQTYLALPTEARRVAGSATAGDALVAGLFAVSGVLALAGQLKVTGWFKARFSPGTCLVIGMALMALAFVAPVIAARAGSIPAATALVVAAGMLALGTVAVFPFEMDTVVRLAVAAGQVVGSQESP